MTTPQVTRYFRPTRNGLNTLPDSDTDTDSGLGFHTQWLHCTMQKMFTLHRLKSWTPTPYFYIVQVSKSVSGNVFKP